jgi:putative restriction endonuclease
MGRREELEEQWRRSVAGLKTWQRGGKRAVHKPLLTLLLVARAEEGTESRLSFYELERPLEGLLRRFGPPTKSVHPEYPFWHLQSDGFWKIADAARLPLKKAGRSPARRTLRTYDAQGAVPDPMWRVLMESSELRRELADRILGDYWPPGMHAEIREAVGLREAAAPEQDREQVTRAKRDPLFREAVLRAYEWRCAVCSYDGRLAEQSLALEAAHVRWHCYGGEDRVENALALCAFHHAALDRGAIGLSESHRILVSADVHGGEAVRDWLLRYSGRKLVRPQSGSQPPAPPNVRWHARQVFRAPARN